MCMIIQDNDLNFLKQQLTFYIEKRTDAVVDYFKVTAFQ